MKESLQIGSHCGRVTIEMVTEEAGSFEGHTEGEDISQRAVDDLNLERERFERLIRPSGESTRSICIPQNCDLLFACECVAGLYCIVILESWVI